MSAFTKREQKLMAAACQSFEGEPKLDMDKFAQRAGLTVGSARNAWAALKKKMYAQDDTGVKATAAKTPATKSAKKRPPPVILPANDNGSDDDEVPTFSKKPKSSATKAKGKGQGKATRSENDDDDGFVEVKKEVANEDFEEV